MKKIVLILMLLTIPGIAISQTDATADVWQPLRFLEGTWQGRGEGMSGQSTVTQEYEFVLGGKFLRMQTKAIFEPQEKNPDGEIHEDFAMFSYDKLRRTFVVRAFYVEGFVNTYVLSETSEDGKTFAFETESVENAPPGTRAKLIFKQVADGELEESFFVAFPGKEFGCFSTNRLTSK